jgi:hypothetical protein
MAWRLRTKLASISDVYQQVIGQASTQYVTGQLVGYTIAAGTQYAGILQQISTQTGQPTHIVDSVDPQPYNGQSEFNVNGKNSSPLRPATPLLTTANGEKLLLNPINPLQLYDCDVVPCYNRVTPAANTTVANVIISNTDNNTTPVTYATSNGALVGATVYLPEQDWQGVVTADVYSSSSYTGSTAGRTLTIQPPPPRACTTGDTVSVLPFGCGALVKWDPTNFSTTISNVLADATGGLAYVREINMQYPSNLRGSLAQVTCSIKSPVQ